MKKYFITGLLIWIPLVITIWVLKLVVDVLDQSLLLLPVSLQTENWLGVHIPGLGAILTVVDRKSTRLDSSHLVISYAVFCLKKKHKQERLSCTLMINVFI